MTPHKFARALDSLFQNAAYVAFSFLRNLAPFITPAAPAFFFGHAVYTAVALTAPHEVALGVGGASALGIESSGIMSAHAMIKFYSQGQYLKAFFAAVLFALYLCAGIGGLTFFDGTYSDLKTIGMTMFGISGIVYLVLALVADVVAQEQSEAKQEQSTAALANQGIAFEQDFRLKQLEARKEVALAKIPLLHTNGSRPKAESKAEAGAFACPACGKGHANQKELSGHGPARCAKKLARPIS